MPRYLSRFYTWSGNSYVRCTKSLHACCDSNSKPERCRRHRSPQSKHQNQSTPVYIACSSHALVVEVLGTPYLHYNGRTSFAPWSSAHRSREIEPTHVSSLLFRINIPSSTQKAPLPSSATLAPLASSTHLVQPTVPTAAEDDDQIPNARYWQ